MKRVVFIFIFLVLHTKAFQARAGDPALDQLPPGGSDWSRMSDAVIRSHRPELNEIFGWWAGRCVFEPNLKLTFASVLAVVPSAPDSFKMYMRGRLEVGLDFYDEPESSPDRRTIEEDFAFMESFLPSVPNGEVSSRFFSVYVPETKLNERFRIAVAKYNGLLVAWVGGVSKCIYHKKIRTGRDTDQ